MIKIGAGDPGSDQRFGFAVAISDDTAVVSTANEQGAVYVFERNQSGPDAWGEVKKIAAADVGAGSYFGSSVAIIEGKMVVGCPWENSSSGSVYVFERNHGGADAWGFVEKLTAGDAASSDFFGNAVAMTSQSVAVGAPWDDDGGSASGSSYLFRLTDSSPTIIFADDFETGDTTAWSGTP